MSSKAKPGGENRRASHMGWLLVSLVVEQYIKITPVEFSKAKLLKMGFPKSFIWPEFQDYDGAKMLVEAVMSHDLAAIQALNARYPVADFGLGEWVKTVEEKQHKTRATIVEVIKRERLPRGFVLEHVLETNTVTGERTLLKALTDGKTRIASEVIAYEPATAQESAP